MIKNKKGFLNEPGMLLLMGFAAILTFAIIMLIVINLGDKPKKDQASQAIASLKHNIMLINYLATPVKDVPGIQNVADLIILAVQDTTHRPKLEEISEKILTPFFEKPLFWEIKIEGGYSFTEKTYSWTLGHKIWTLEQKIPNHIGKSPSFYTVKLIKWKD